MKKSSLLITLCVISFSGHAQWKQLNSGTTANLFDLYFINNNTGFVGGGIYPDYTLLKTIDGGQSWINISVPTDYPIQGIFFLTDSIGFIASGEIILKTIDQGNSWDTVFVKKDLRIYNIQFINNVVGFAATDNDNFSFGGELLKTSDGGLTWKLLTPAFEVLVDYSFMNEDTGILSAFYNYPYAYLTTNGGKGWSPVLGPLTYTESFNCVTIESNFFFIDRTGALLISTDTGTTWTSYATPGLDYKNMVFTSDSDGWMVGKDIARTKDGGHTWMEDDSTYSKYGQSLNHVRFPSHDTGYAVGDGGLILKHTGSSIATGGIDEKENRQLIIYPNPASGDLNLKLPHINDDVIIISVSDLLGRVVQSQEVSINNQSTFVLNLNPQLENGLYFLTVEGGNQSLQKIFEVQR